MENIRSFFLADWCTEGDCAKAMRDTLKTRGTYKMVYILYD